MGLSRRSLGLPLGLLPLLAGCRSPDPRLYSLVVPPGPALPGGPKVVALRDVSLAGYLDRLQIVRSSEDFRLTVSDSEWWGEPLGGMLTRVLAVALAQRLPRSSVVGADTAISVSPDVTVEISIQRLDSDGEGAVALVAQIAIGQRAGRRAPIVRSFNTAVPQVGTDARSFVAAASVAVGRLADASAGLLQSF
ncbi:membrane integrity-associated transporter subunit PqiC [Dankookia sp. GCM10030260]|uniref:PqiC family protein n=1 Tax=Dankookia sp. GCM10030260 TaxID=3273390 RepID=UPI00361F7389